MKRKISKRLLLVFLILFFIVLVILEFVLRIDSKRIKDQFLNQANPNLIYTVDEVVNSNFKEGTQLSATGTVELILVDTYPDYEGPGGGYYLVGQNSRILLIPSTEITVKELKVIIKVKGKVSYCGGKKIKKYICELKDVELIKD